MQRFVTGACRLRSASVGAKRRRRAARKDENAEKKRRNLPSIRSTTPFSPRLTRKLVCERRECYMEAEVFDAFGEATEEAGRIASVKEVSAQFLIGDLVFEHVIDGYRQ